MKYYKLNKPIIPEPYVKDVLELKNFIIERLNIFISNSDTYLFWDKVSDYFDAGWLGIDFHYEGETREEFLLDQLEKYGVIKDEEE